MEYIITARGEYKGFHRSLDRAIGRAEQLAANPRYECDVQIREFISEETPHNLLPVIWDSQAQS